jgi:malate dehydrogenase (oxaloacetate-decarboxylating)
MDYRKASLKIHEDLKGKFGIYLKGPLENIDHLSTLYTPGVAEPCKKIYENIENVYRYTGKGNMVAVITDGSAVLGLGNIGGTAGLPVMEGKAILFKRFGGIDAIPICLNTQNTEEIISTVKAVCPTFGGINLEDISAPRCFEIERRLKRELPIPVFHDDQHGTAVVTLAGMINALKKIGKKKDELRILINGAGSAGIAITRILLEWNVATITVCDSRGILTPDNRNQNIEKQKIAEKINPQCRSGTLYDALEDADVFIGVSAPDLLTKDDILRMAKNPIIFAMANPDPEILPAEAYAGGAKIVATGRSDFINQVNNVLAFPGIFRGALDVRSRDITEGMKVAAAQAIAGLVSDNDLENGIIIPEPFNPKIPQEVAYAVALKAIEEGIAGEPVSECRLRSKIESRLCVRE